MAKLTIIEDGFSSAELIAGLNTNFTFVESLQTLDTEIITLTNAMQGQTLLNNININFIALNARLSSPITLTSITSGITGSVFNVLFTNLIEGIGRAVNGHGYFIEDEVSTLHLCTTRGNKILAFDGVDTVSLSLNNGRTYPYSKQVSGMESIICYAYIWLTGEIMFCTHTKVYYSHDNLTTVNESHIVDINGSDWTPPKSYGNFSPLGLGQYHKDDIPYWGTYAAQNDTPLNECNAWYSIDKGMTVKSWFKLNTTLSLSGSHIHNVNYNINSDTFLMTVGDSPSSWVESTYNSITDTWSHSLIKQGLNYSSAKIAGFIFRGDDIYWASDSNDSSLQGIWTCKYADITNEAAYTRTFIGSGDAFTIIGDEDELIVTYNLINKVDISLDAINFYLHTSVNALIGNDRGSFMAFTPKNNRGFYRGEIWSTNEGNGAAVIKTMYLGAVYLIKINH